VVAEKRQKRKELKKGETSHRGEETQLSFVAERKAETSGNNEAADLTVTRLRKKKRENRVTRWERAKGEEKDRAFIGDDVTLSRSRKSQPGLGGRTKKKDDSRRTWVRNGSNPRSGGI